MRRTWTFATGMLIAVALAGGGGVVLGMSLPRQSEAAPASTPTPSGYGDLLDEEIRGLDAETIEGYRTGLGLGMALPAELNGYPGPRHVLDMADDLNLTDEQREAVQQLFDSMQAEAVPLGEEILAAEAALESAFRDKSIDEDMLNEQIENIAAMEAALRYVHLRTHLAMMDILTEQQVQHYNVVRGYANAGDLHHNPDNMDHHP